MKRFLELFLSIILIITLHGCRSNDVDVKKASNTYRDLIKLVDESEIDFKSEEQKKIKVETNQRILNEYIDTVNNKNYTFEYVMLGLGENNQLSKVYRTQSQDNYIEINIINADDDNPDTIFKYAYINDIYYNYFDDGINEPQIKKSTDNDNKNSLFNDLSYLATYTVQLNKKDYVCEVWKSSKGKDLEFYFRNNQLVGIKYQASDNVVLKYHILSFSKMAEPQNIKIPK